MKSCNAWYIYIIECEDGTLYTGITKDLQRRFNEHLRGGRKGAKYLKSHHPKSVVYTEFAPNRSLATKREYQIKKMSKSSKLLLINEKRTKLSKVKIA